MEHKAHDDWNHPRIGSGQSVCIYVRMHLGLPIKGCKMDFGHGGGPRPSWGGVPDDGYMRGATMPPSADFGAVISRIPTEQGGGIYNPGPSAADASTQMFGKPHGELFLGPQDSKISAASFAPIVHSLFVRDIGAGTYTEGERFFTKGHLMAVLRLHKAVEEKSITRKMRRSLNKRWQSKIEPTNAILGPVYNEALGTTPLVGYECTNPRPPRPPARCWAGQRYYQIALLIACRGRTGTGLFPLSEGSFFTPHRDTEQLAITIHDHAEVVTENPKDVEKILTRDSGNDALWQYEPPPR